MAKSPAPAPAAAKPLSKTAATALISLQADLLKADPAKLDPSKLLAMVTKIVTFLLSLNIPWDLIVEILTKKKLPIPTELKPKS